MTRLGLISDVHADLHALTATLDHLKKLGCDRVLCGGDLFDYGLFPAETLALIRERKIPCVRGNHDRWAVEEIDGELHDKSGWDLSNADLRFLASLPPLRRATMDGLRVVITHGRPGSDTSGIYPESEEDTGDLLQHAGADILIVGHTHRAFSALARAGGLIVNPGSLLCHPAFPPGDDWSDPREGAVAPIAGGGSFGVLELPTKRFTLHSVLDGKPLDPTA